jgi:phosphoglycolate phosphatase
MLVVFDWDGTVSDSMGKIVRCVQAAAADLRLPSLPEEAILEIIGLSLGPAIARLYPHLSYSDVSRLSAAYSRHYLADEHIPGFYPGAREALEQLHDADFILAVATGKSRQGLNRVLAQLNAAHLFSDTRCADETASKPHPRMLTELLQACDVPSERAVMVGDTEFDMAMAKTIGMQRIAVSYGAHSVERLKAYEPAMCVHDLRLIVPWLINQKAINEA